MPEKMDMKPMQNIILTTRKENLMEIGVCLIN